MPRTARPAVTSGGNMLCAIAITTAKTVSAVLGKSNICAPPGSQATRFSEGDARHLLRSRHADLALEPQKRIAR